MFVSHIVDQNNILLAFGSGTYFEKENYYEDDVSEECYGHQSIRNLWIEGMVSMRKVLGNVVLSEIERKLIELANQINPPRKVINVMSVEESVGFAGTGNLQLGKAFEGDTLNDYDMLDFSDCGCESYLYSYLNIPANVNHGDFLEYFLENMECDGLFKDNVSLQARKIVTEYIVNKLA